MPRDRGLTKRAITRAATTRSSAHPDRFQMLKRTKHWATRELNDHMIERGGRPHEYGKNDCAIFAADGIKAMTGVDIAEDFRGYAGPMGAQRAIAKITGGSTV